VLESRAGETGAADPYDAPGHAANGWGLAYRGLETLASCLAPSSHLVTSELGKGDAALEE
jgi:hypothetical protein